MSTIQLVSLFIVAGLIWFLIICASARLYDREISALVKDWGERHRGDVSIGPAMPLTEVLRQAKFGRPAAVQQMIDRWIDEAR